jgi:hypothetical protein
MLPLKLHVLVDEESRRNLNFKTYPLTLWLSRGKHHGEVSEEGKTLLLAQAVDGDPTKGFLLELRAPAPGEYYLSLWGGWFWKGSIPLPTAETQRVICLRVLPSAGANDANGSQSPPSHGLNFGESANEGQPDNQIAYGVEAGEAQEGSTGAVRPLSLDGLRNPASPFRGGYASKASALREEAGADSAQGGLRARLAVAGLRVSSAVTRLASRPASPHTPLESSEEGGDQRSTGKVSDGAGANEALEWACPACTFVNTEPEPSRDAAAHSDPSDPNHARLWRCEMCTTAYSAKRKKRETSSNLTASGDNAAKSPSADPATLTSDRIRDNTGRTVSDSHNNTSYPAPEKEFATLKKENVAALDRSTSSSTASSSSIQTSFDLLIQLYYLSARKHAQAGKDPLAEARELANSPPCSDPALQWLKQLCFLTELVSSLSHFDADMVLRARGFQLIYAQLTSQPAEPAFLLVAERRRATDGSGSELKRAYLVVRGTQNTADLCTDMKVDAAVLSCDLLSAEVAQGLPQWRRESVCIADSSSSSRPLPPSPHSRPHRRLLSLCRSRRLAPTPSPSTAPPSRKSIQLVTP